MGTSLKERIRPLWVLFSTRWGGPEQVAMGDMVDMVNSGIPIHLVCLEGSPVHAAALRHPKIQLYPQKYYASGIFDFTFTKTLRGLVDKLEANIIHINDEQLLWYLEIALFGRPEISIIANRHTLAEKSMTDFWRNFLLRRLDYMIVLSESVRLSVLRRGMLGEKKVKVINLGLDFSRFDPHLKTGRALRDQWGADDNTIVIGSVGRLVPEVGQDTFIKAAAGLLKHQQWKMKFVIVGEDPLVASEEYLQSLKDLARLFHIEEQVHFSALSDNLPEVMAAFDVFVMPGREEVPGLGALEALAMERPVVLSNVVGAEEIVGHKEFGLLVRPEDAFDLQNKILKLLENSERRRQMGQKGRQHVLKHFDKRTRSIRSVDVYERCVKRRFAMTERPGIR